MNQQADERLPPQDLESERRLLGSCFTAHQHGDLSDFDLDTIRTIIGPEGFFTPQHRQLWQAILDTVDAGEPIDPAAVLPRLRQADRNGRWEETIRELSAEGEPANTLFYAKSICEQWRRREIIRQCTAAIDRAYDPTADAKSGAITTELADRLEGITADTPHGANIVTANRIEREHVGWLWDGRIPAGKLVVFAGPPGVGKSFVSLDLAARLSTATAWPDGTENPNPPADTLVLSAEDTAPDVIRPRLENSRADLSRIHVPKELCLLDLQRDVGYLRKELDKRPNVRLLILDPLAAMMGIQLDTHRDAAVRAVLSRLCDLADSMKVTVLAIMHLRKAQADLAVHRVGGSIGFVAAARSLWIFVRDLRDESGRRRLMVCAKSSLGPETAGLAFTLERPGCVHWDADGPDITADEALEARKPRGQPAKEEAVEFICTVLADRPRAAKEIRALAKEAGINPKTLQRAKQDLAVQSEEGTVDGKACWFWYLTGQRHLLPWADGQEGTPSK